MIHIDSHTALWLHGERRRLSRTATRLIERETLVISPIALLELELLFELRRCREGGDAIWASLNAQIGLAISDRTFVEVSAIARSFTWTRDPFDRLIVANAMADGARLITADQTILANFKDAAW